MNDGGPAFPRPGSQGVELFIPAEHGMTLRDWFAGQALTGYCVESEQLTIGSHKSAARWCYSMADAMLKARDATP